MLKLLAQIISVALHPLLMPTLIFGFIAFEAPYLLFPFSNHLFFVAFVFFVTYLVPVFIILVLFLTKFIKNLNLDSKNDRLWSMAISIGIYVLACYLMYIKLNVNSKILYIFITIIFGLLVSGIITFFWKISLHSMSVGGLLFFCLFISYYFESSSFFVPFIILTILSGALMSARLLLEKHTPAQVWAGFSLGISIGLVSIFFLPA